MTTSEAMSPAPTPTPRTDAIFRLLDEAFLYKTGYEHRIALRQGARIGVEDLERELAEAKHQLSETDSLLNACVRQHTLMEEQAGRLAGALTNLLILSECADETGYVDDHGFLDVDAIHDTARTELAAWKEGRA